MLPDARFDDPLLNDAFDFSRYPTFKTRNVKSNEQRHRVRGRVALSTCHGSPSSRAQRSRNVSEPQLVSSTYYITESWFTNFASARTVGDIANLASDEVIFPVIHYSQSTTVACDDVAGSGADDGHRIQKTSTAYEDSRDIPGHFESIEGEGEEDSLYSMDSADQEAHPLLLSMPVIPQIRLERKATVKKADPRPLSDAVQNQFFLSPRIRDIRTPARMSSRRYGCILARTSPPTMIPDASLSKDHGRGALGFFETSPRFGTELAYMHSASEPMLNSAYLSNDEDEPPSRKEVDESLHSDVLLSMIDDVDSPPGPNSDLPESRIDELSRPKEVPPGHSKRVHERSSVNYSISFSSIVHAVAGGCASLDLLLRKPNFKLKSATKAKPLQHGWNAHDPTSKWAPKQGQIVIKVFVPSTDEIWMFRVPQDTNLADFTTRVASKLGFSVRFSGSVWDEPRYYFRTDERFKSWVKGRIRFGRNLPIVAHLLTPLPLVRLSVDGDGCEVWCYA